jgi:hypothetical protein
MVGRTKNKNRLPLSAELTPPGFIPPGFTLNFAPSFTPSFVGLELLPSRLDNTLLPKSNNFCPHFCLHYFLDIISFITLFLN